jgi:hypothetical protein
VTEAAEITGELVPLVEKAVAKDGTAKIKIIQAGQGSSGFYPEDVLKRDAGVFKAGTHIYLDHPSVSEESDRPERSVKDLAGSLTGPAAWEEAGSAGPGLYAPVKFVDSVAPHINAIAAISGMSIRAGGKAGTREIGGKKVRTIESIDVAHSVDVVTRAGAGGKIVDLLESARSRQAGGAPPEGSDVDKEKFEKALADLVEAQATIKTQGDELAKLKEAETLRQARILVIEKLAASNLPKLTRDRLTESLVNGATVKDGALDRDALLHGERGAALGDRAAHVELLEADASQPTHDPLPSRRGGGLGRVGDGEGLRDGEALGGESQAALLPREVSLPHETRHAAHPHAHLRVVGVLGKALEREGAREEVVRGDREVLGREDGEPRGELRRGGEEQSGVRVRGHAGGGGALFDALSFVTARAAVLVEGVVHDHAPRRSMERATVTLSHAPFFRFVCPKTRG